MLSRLMVPGSGGGLGGMLGGPDLNPSSLAGMMAMRGPQIPAGQRQTGPGPIPATPPPMPQTQNPLSALGGAGGLGQGGGPAGLLKSLGVGGSSGAAPAASQLSQLTWTSPSDPTYTLPGDFAQQIGLLGPAQDAGGLTGWLSSLFR